MQIPRKVRIGGVDYAVKHTDHSSVGNTLCYGTFDSEKCVIELSNGRELAKERVHQTFLHEILHGVIFAMGLELDDEENAVGTIAKGLYQVIADNPAIFAKPIKQ